MKLITSAILLFSGIVPVMSQTIVPDLRSLDNWQIVNRKAELITEKEKKGVHLNGVPGDGLLLLKGSAFSNGTIEFDVKGKNAPGQSFVGFAFHVQDKDTYEAVYFRPFNFVNLDTIRRWRAVQYVFHPEYTWDKLRAAHPGKYENKIIPVPDPDAWFHVKLVVSGTAVKAFVNNSKAHSLEVERLGKFNSGGLGFWVGNNSEGTFANLVITPAK